MNRGQSPPIALHPLAPSIVAVVFFLVTFAFGLMCRPATSRPVLADISAAIAITVLSIVARYFARWAVLGTPLNWDIAGAVALLAAATFLSFTAGGFVRYLIQSQSDDAPNITFATDLSRFLLRRHLTDPEEIGRHMKAVESTFHAVLAVLTTIAALLGTWGAIDKLHHPPPPAAVDSPQSTAPATQ